MYRLKVKDSIFTIPKENIRLLAMSKAMDLGQSNLCVCFDNDEYAIKYLRSIGIEVEEIVKA